MDEFLQWLAELPVLIFSNSNNEPGIDVGVALRLSVLAFIVLGVVAFWFWALEKIDSRDLDVKKDKRPN